MAGGRSRRGLEGTVDFHSPIGTIHSALEALIETRIRNHWSSVACGSHAHALRPDA